MISDISITGRRVVGMYLHIFSSLGGAVKMKESAIKLMENDAKMLYFSVLPSGHSVFLTQRPRRKSFPQHMTLKSPLETLCYGL